MIIYDNHGSEKGGITPPIHGHFNEVEHDDKPLDLEVWYLWYPTFG